MMLKWLIETLIGASKIAYYVINDVGLLLCWKKLAYETRNLYHVQFIVCANGPHDAFVLSS